MAEVQRTRIDAFLVGDAGVIAQALMQLVVANINGKHVISAALQQHLRKTTGRRADIECSQALHIKIEVIKRCYEF